MIKNKKVSLVIPCYNEEKGLEELLSKNDFSKIDEIIVVDNNCTDRTVEIANKYKCRVLTEKKKGYGAAYKRGLYRTNGDIIVTMDGDNTYPVSDIEKLVGILEDENYDFISTNRLGGGKPQNMKFMNYCGNILLTLAIRLFFWESIKDSQSGMWVFKRGILDKMKLESDGMAFSQEIKMEAVKRGFKFREVDIHYNERIGNVKLERLKDGIQNLYFIFYKRFFSDLTKHNFLVFVGIIAVLFLYVFLSLQHIKDPFVRVTEDENGNIGMAAENLAKYGLFDQKFGIHTYYVNSEVELVSPYLHHSGFYVWPTVLAYKMFGISELTTRLPSVVLNILVIILFYLAIYRLYNKKFTPAFLTALILVILPGFVYFNKLTSHVAYMVFAYLLVFSCFIFFVTAEKRIKLATFFLALSIIYSGMLHWFAYFFPLGIWIFALFFKKALAQEKRRLLLYVVPLALVLVTVINFYYLYLLGGSSTFIDLKSAYGFRSSVHQPVGMWLNFLIKDRATLNFNWFFILSGFAGLVLFIIIYLRKKLSPNFAILAVLWISPIGLAYVFYQWITHPFGILVFLPAIAVFSGWLFYEIIKKFKVVGIIVVILLMGLGFFLSIQKLNYIYSDFRILGDKDIQLIKEVSLQVKDNELCLGDNQMGLGYQGIVEWYTQKKLGSLEKNDCKLLLLFRAGVSQEYFDEKNKLYSEKGFNQGLGCAEYLCLLKKS